MFSHSSDPSSSKLRPTKDDIRAIVETFTSATGFKQKPETDSEIPAAEPGADVRAHAAPKARGRGRGRGRGKAKAKPEPKPKKKADVARKRKAEPKAPPSQARAKRGCGKDR